MGIGSWRSEAAFGLKIDARLRIIRKVEHVPARNRPGNGLLVGHGAFGTLMYCHY